MTADNIQLACNTQKISHVSGLLGCSRKNALIWIIAMLALCGMPPSPLFLTEMVLVNAVGPYLGGAVLILLFVVFAGMTYHALRMVMGTPAALALEKSDVKSLEKLTVIPALTLTLALVAGIAAVVMIVLNEFHIMAQ